MAAKHERLLSQLRDDLNGVASTTIDAQVSNQIVSSLWDKSWQDYEACKKAILTLGGKYPSNKIKDFQRYALGFLDKLADGQKSSDPKQTFDSGQTTKAKTVSKKNVSDAKLFAQAEREFNEDKEDEGLWINALANCDWDGDAAFFEYIKLKVEDLKAGTKRKPGESAAPEYIKAYLELQDKSYDEDLWTKASILAKRDEDKTTCNYINQRAEELRELGWKPTPQKKSSRGSDPSSNQSTANNSTKDKARGPEIETFFGFKGFNWTYIKAWLVAAITSNILNNVIQTLISQNISGQNEIEAYYVYGPFVAGGIALITWISVLNFNSFKLIRVNVLLPWLVFVSFVIEMVFFAITEQNLRRLGIELPQIAFVCQALAFGTWLGLFYLYGRNFNRS